MFHQLLWSESPEFDPKPFFWHLRDSDAVEASDDDEPKQTAANVLAMQRAVLMHG